MRAVLDHPEIYDVAVADCGCHDNRMDKIWWNEPRMGWPVDESYARSSNVADAHRLRGRLMLIVGELDDNVDPASTLQLSAALVKAGKDHELVVIPGAGHGAAETPYGSMKRLSFLERHLLDAAPPHPSLAWSPSLMRSGFQMRGGAIRPRGRPGAGANRPRGAGRFIHCVAGRQRPLLLARHGKTSEKHAARELSPGWARNAASPCNARGTAFA